MSRIKVHTVRRRGKPGGPNLEEVVAARTPWESEGGYLNPRWIEWLMGFPVGWCAGLSKLWEMQSSPRRRKSSPTDSPT